ncbi:MAG: DUF86 domain-containing protein [Firmicutes bacterium]|nr:DUF86 domain-containing protein [Bacillota bacterium]
MPQRNDDITLQQIAKAGDKIRQWLMGISRDEFVDNEILQSAVIRQLEIIGEGVSRLTPEFRQTYPALLPWAQIKALRNLLIHGYDDIDIDRVWKVATEDIPRLANVLQTFRGSEDEHEP